MKDPCRAAVAAAVSAALTLAGGGAGTACAQMLRPAPSVGSVPGGAVSHGGPTGPLSAGPALQLSHPVLPSGAPALPAPVLPRLEPRPSPAPAMAASPKGGSADIAVRLARSVPTAAPVLPGPDTAHAEATAGAQRPAGAPAPVAKGLRRWLRAQARRWTQPNLEDSRRAFDGSPTRPGLSGAADSPVSGGSSTRRAKSALRRPDSAPRPRFDAAGLPPAQAVRPPGKNGGLGPWVEFAAVVAGAAALAFALVAVPALTGHLPAFLHWSGFIGMLGALALAPSVREDWAAKLSRVGDSDTEVLVVFKPGVPLVRAAEVIRGLGATAQVVASGISLEGQEDRTLVVRDSREAARIARLLAGTGEVSSVGVSANVRAALAAALASRIVADPGLFGRDIWVRGRDGVSEFMFAHSAANHRLVETHDSSREDGFWAMRARTFEAAAELARLLMTIPSVEELRVSPELLARLNPAAASDPPPAHDSAPAAERPPSPATATPVEPEDPVLPRPEDAGAEAPPAAPEAREPAPEPAHPPAVAPAPTAPQRRDPEAEWLAWLAARPLRDGTKLNQRQVQVLSTFLRPVSKHPSEPRAPVVARHEEVKRILPVVTSPRGMRNSVILVGEAGVGKTAVAEGVAQLIEDAEHAAAADPGSYLSFARLRGRWLVELDLNRLLSSDESVSYMSHILELLPLLNGADPGRGNEVIVLMDEVQKLFLDAAGQKLANALKGPLRDGRVSIIATTTSKEFKQHIEADDAFRRRFEKVVIEEPRVEQTTAILRGMRAYLETLHGAVVSDEALTAAASLSDQFDKANYNPDKAVKAVRDAAELARPENHRAAFSLDIRETWERLDAALDEARRALAEKGVASALTLPAEAYNLLAGLVVKAEALYAGRAAVEDGPGRVDAAAVKRVIAEKTGIASGQLDLAADDAGRYAAMETSVGERVINQEPALTAIANAIRRNKAGLSNPHRPMGKFLLTGPTGVGKTLMAKELARFLFNDPEAMIRMDMSEYMEDHTAMRLTGAPPSYIGYEEGGQLTEAVRKKPYSVLLFDEVEKAHPRVFDLLLQILDDGRLTDGQGRTVDFSNTVIIMTANAGAGLVDGERFAGDIARAQAAEGTPEERARMVADIAAAWDAQLDAAAQAAIESRFRPEFLNRLDEDPHSRRKWIRVNRLRRQDASAIARLQLAEFSALLAARYDADLAVDPSAVEFLAQEGFSAVYGARPMGAAVEKHLVDPLARWILEEAAQGRRGVRGRLVTARAQGGRIVFEAGEKPPSAVARAEIAGAAGRMAAALLELLERWAGPSGEAPPTEADFDALMRTARGAAPPAARPQPPAFLNPGLRLDLPAGARVVSGAHNRPKAADKPLREAVKGIGAAMAGAGWPAEAVAAVAGQAGQVGEGWTKQFIALAKTAAEREGAAEPVALASSVDAESVRLAFSFAGSLAEAEKAMLAAHFSGTPPESYEAARRTADALTSGGSAVRNHLLLDLYRRLRALPGARMGYASDGGRGQLWLELRRDPSSAPEPPASVRPISPTRPTLLELFLGVLEQRGIAPGKRDGPSIRIAAAEGYARLAGPAEAALMRSWLAERDWGTDTNRLADEAPLAMTAALVLGRLGTAADSAALETVLRRSGGIPGDEFNPLKEALVAALAECYAKAGAPEVHDAIRRAANLAWESRALLTRAGVRALSKVGRTEDFAAVKAADDGEALAELSLRLGRGDVFRTVLLDAASWSEASEAGRFAALRIAGTAKTPDRRTWDALKRVMSTQGDHSLRLAAAQAWADLVARTGLTRGLSAGLSKYLEAQDVAKDDPATWSVLLAYVLALAECGGAEDLPALEHLLTGDPDDVHYRHEQAHFAAPEAWARIVVRSGLLPKLMRPGRGPSGAPLPSPLQEMLASREKPLLAAAALRAMALSTNEPGPAPAASGDAPALRMP